MLINGKMRCAGCTGLIENENIICKCGCDNQNAHNSIHCLPIGTVLIGEYVVGSVIGEGGFGITYVGWDLSLDIKVAIKEFFPNGYSSRNTTVSTDVIANIGRDGEYFEGKKEKFINEAKVLASFMDEPGIVSVQRFFRANNTAYIVMEFVEGTTLKEHLKSKGRMSIEETLGVINPIMDSLAKVHGKNLIHRDISPDNIMMDVSGRGKLIDFGAARDTSDYKTDMSVVLKYGFAPAEQYQSHGNQGPWTDVYALSATIYNCITGVVPISSIDRMAGEVLASPHELCATCSEAVSSVIMRGLSLNANDRYANISQFQKEITAAASGDISVDADRSSNGNEANGRGSAYNQNVKKKKANKSNILVAILVAAVLVSGAILIYLIISVSGDSKGLDEDGAVSTNSGYTDVAEEESNEEKNTDGIVASDSNFVTSVYAKGGYYEWCDEHFLSSDYSGELGDLFPELKGIDIDCDGLEDKILRTSQGDTGTLEIQFGNGKEISYTGLTSWADMYEAVTFCDVDGDGLNEILNNIWWGSTGGGYIEEVTLYDQKTDGSWDKVELYTDINDILDESKVLQVADADISKFFKLRMTDESYYSNVLRDVRISSDGIFYIYDFGMKNHAAMNMDLFAVQFKLIDGQPVLKNVSREKIADIWSENYEDSDYQVKDFIQFDGILDGTIPMYTVDGEEHYISDYDEVTSNGVKYEYCDIDNDYNRELLISLYGCEVYIAKWNGSEIESQFVGYSGGSSALVTAEDELVLVDSAHEGRISYDVMKMNSMGEMENVVSFVWWWPNEYSGVTENEYYKVEGTNGGQQTITSDEYEELVAKYVPKYKTEWKVYPN